MKNARPGLFSFMLFRASETTPSLWHLFLIRQHDLQKNGGRLVSEGNVVNGCASFYDCENQQNVGGSM